MANKKKRLEELLKRYEELTGKNFSNDNVPTIEQLEVAIAGHENAFETGVEFNDEACFSSSDSSSDDTEDSPTDENQPPAKVNKRGDARKKQKPSSNFKDFAGLVREYKTGKMNERKRIAFRIRLMKLAKDEDTEIYENEFEFLLVILRREREKGVLSSVDGYFLHEVEADACEDICFVKTDDAPVVHDFKEGFRVSV